MKKHTRATPANVPRSRSKWTRRQRRDQRLMRSIGPALALAVEDIKGWVKTWYYSERPQVLE